MVPPRTGRRQVGRTANPLQPGDLRLEALLVPHVVAEREGVDPRVQQSLRHGAGEASAGRGVLRVGDHEIEPEIGAQPRQPVGHNLAARPADHVTDEQQFQHGPDRWASPAPRRVPKAVPISRDYR